jgi:hypothetical protein
MDGLSLIQEARAAGLSVAAAGDRLVIRGPRQAEPVARKLIAHKSKVLAALAENEGVGIAADVHEGLPDDAEAEAVDLRHAYEERVGIRLYDAGYTRHEAERLAYGETIEHWCERHPLRLQPGSCAGCGEPLATAALELPDGARVHWERDREFKCLISYGFRRKHRAVEALAMRGLQPPIGWGI